MWICNLLLYVTHIFLDMIFRESQHQKWLLTYKKVSYDEYTDWIEMSMFDMMADERRREKEGKRKILGSAYVSSLAVVKMLHDVQWMDRPDNRLNVIEITSLSLFTKSKAITANDDKVGSLLFTSLRMGMMIENTSIDSSLLSFKRFLFSTVLSPFHSILYIKDLLRQQKKITIMTWHSFISSSHIYSQRGDLWWGDGNRGGGGRHPFTESWDGQTQERRGETGASLWHKVTWEEWKLYASGKHALKEHIILVRHE